MRDTLWHVIVVAAKAESQLSLRTTGRQESFTNEKLHSAPSSSYTITKWQLSDLCFVPSD